MVLKEYAKPGHPATPESPQEHYDRRNGGWDGQLPNADLVAQVPPAKPVDLRDRKDGGHLDRTAWAFDFRRRHGLTPLQGYVLAYAAFRASAYRQFLFDDSLEQVADAVGCKRHAAGKAIAALVGRGALYQLSNGKGGHSTKASRYRIRGAETGWRVPGLDHEWSNGRLASIEPETSPEQWTFDAEQWTFDADSMDVSRDFNGRQTSNPPVPPPVTHPVVEDISYPTTTTHPCAVATAPNPAAAAASLSSLESKDSTPTTGDVGPCWGDDCSETPVIFVGEEYRVCVGHAVSEYWEACQQSCPWASQSKARGWYSRNIPALQEVIDEWEADELADYEAKEAQREYDRLKAEERAKAAQEAEERRLKQIQDRADAETALDARLTPDQRQWRLAAKAITSARLLGGYETILRDIDVEAITVSGGTLALPFKSKANLERFAALLADSRPTLVDTVRTFLPDVAHLEPSTPAHADDCRCPPCHAAVRQAERDKAAEFIRDHVAEWEFDPKKPAVRPGRIPTKEYKGWVPPEEREAREQAGMVC